MAHSAARNYYDPWISSFHGIGPDDTATAPEFESVWFAAQDLVGDRVVLMHNAGFDMSVVRAETAMRGLPAQTMTYGCTLVLSRRHLDPMDSYSLPDVCDVLGIDFRDHHDPVADARASAAVAMALMAASETANPRELADRLRVRLGVWGPDDVRCRGRRLSAPAAVTAAPDDDADPDHPLFSKRLVFTGTLTRWRRADAASAAASCGVRVVAAMSPRVDYLVIGIQDHRRDDLTSKHRKAEELRAAGGKVRIITEYEFDRLLGEPG